MWEPLLLRPAMLHSLFAPVAAYTPTVGRGYCVTEHHFVLNHCAWFVRQDERGTHGQQRQDNKCSLNKKQLCFTISNRVLHFKNNPLCSRDWQDFTLGLHAAWEPAGSVCCANESTGFLSSRLGQNCWDNRNRPLCSLKPEGTAGQWGLLNI